MKLPKWQYITFWKTDGSFMIYHPQTKFESNRRKLNTYFSILDPLYWILKIPLTINDRPTRESPNTKVKSNRRNLNIFSVVLVSLLEFQKTPYWSMISQLGNSQISNSNRKKFNILFTILDPPYFILKNQSQIKKN